MADKRLKNMPRAPARKRELERTPMNDLEHSFERWFGYCFEQPRNLGVYEVKNNSFVLRDLGLMATRHSGAFSNLCNAWKSFALFPRSTVVEVSLPSDWDAISSDWAMVGSDLYQAIQRYKMNSHCVRTESDHSEPEPATTTR
jgi:hypothetical protein